LEITLPISRQLFPYSGLFMDFDLLKRHFAHIGARVQVRSDGRRSGRTAREGNVTLDVLRDRCGELFDVRIMPMAEPRIEVLQAVPDQRHLLLLTQAHATAEKNKFLCGHDERHWFVAAVPGRSVATVSSAMEALKPPGLAALEARIGLSERQRNRRKNEVFRRQGEWFFVPALRLMVDPKQVLHNEPVARSGSKAHWLEFAYRSGGETVFVTERYPNGLLERQYRDVLLRNSAAKKWRWWTARRNPTLYAKGRVRHSDHATIVLHDWHQVLMNRESDAPAMRHVAFLD
jgi:hypothetical protein